MFLDFLKGPTTGAKKLQGVPGPRDACVHSPPALVPKDLERQMLQISIEICGPIFWYDLVQY